MHRRDWQWVSVRQRDLCCAGVTRALARATRALVTAIVTAAALSACERGLQASAGSVATTVPRVVINEVMANPRSLPDERGEWFELRNFETRSIDLRGWSIASGNDRGVTIDRSVVLPPAGIIVLAREPESALSAAFAYGSSVSLGNGADWIAVRLPDGRMVDSVAWTSPVAGASRALREGATVHADLASDAWETSTQTFGGGDRGTPARPNATAVAAPRAPAPAVAQRSRTESAPGTPPSPAPRATGAPSLGAPARD